MTVQEVKCKQCTKKCPQEKLASDIAKGRMYATNEFIQCQKELEQYRALGTVEELKEAREKQVAKKPIVKEMPYSEEVGFNDEVYCPTCGAYVGYSTELMREPEQMKYCNECGQHIAKDWGEEDEEA